MGLHFWPTSMLLLVLLLLSRYFLLSSGSFSLEALDDHLLVTADHDWSSSSASFMSLIRELVSPNYNFSSTGNASDLYVDLNDRENVAWEDLKATLDIGINSYGPALGSTIAVNHVLINLNDSRNYADRMMQDKMLIHTPTSTYISDRYFDLQTRWYQHDQNTQIFRMFRGDDTICNARRLAPRVEAFNAVSWRRGDGWYEFSGRFTFVLLRAATVFQIKHNNQFWSMQLVVNSDKTTGTWNLVYKKLGDESARRIIQKDILGKSFDIRVIDDGTYHKVYIDGDLRVVGSMTDRLDKEHNKARWGFYSPGSTMDRDILLFVTGAFVGPYKSTAPSVAPTPPIPETTAPSDAPSTAPSIDRTAAIRSCTKIIHVTCDLRQYYLGSDCWLTVVDAQCPGLEPYEDEVSQSFEKAAFRRCVRVVSRRCTCGSGLYQCAQRLSRRVCKFPVSINDKGAILYKALWKRLVRRCG